MKNTGTNTMEDTVKTNQTDKASTSSTATAEKVAHTQDTSSTTPLRLAKPKHKGILPIIFSRVLIIGVLLVLQVFLFFGAYAWLKQYVPYFAGLSALLTIVVIFYLFNNQMDSTAKLTWFVIISIAPVPGTLFLLYTQINFGHIAETKRVRSLLQQTKDNLKQDPEVLEELENDTSGTKEMMHYANRSGNFPLYKNTEVTYFPQGEDKFNAMLVELEKAKKFIFMEYFIIEEGYMWGSILEILARKAKEGVDVRVMYDGLCEITTLPANYPKLLGKLGIKTRLFSPLTPFLSTHYNYRDHRKILVIDGQVAFNGGVNLADEYINHITRFGHWKDTAVMLKGSAVQSFTQMFLHMWNIEEKAPDFSPALITPTPIPSPGYVMPFGECPLDHEKVAESIYIDILYKAHRYVHIMTPYLILDGELETALKYASERGIDIRLILPGIPDKKTAYSLAKSHYKSLVSSGVKIYEYTPGFVHAKVVVSDDLRAVVGTINFDYRSLYHHFECATYLHGTPCISSIESDFQSTLTRCRQVTPATIKKEKLSYKIKGSILKLFAPLF